MCSRSTERLFHQSSDSGSLYSSHNSQYTSDSEGNNTKDTHKNLVFVYFIPNHVLFKALFLLFITKPKKEENGQLNEKVDE